MSQANKLPANLYLAEQVRQLDAALIAAGTPGFELMQRAAQATWQALLQKWPEAGELTVLTGHGNNAGDGYLIAWLAQRAGWVVRVITVADPSRLQGDAALAWQAAVAAGIRIEHWPAEAELRGVVVDALLGTGLSGEVREPCAAAIKQINTSGLPVVAVDIPSGLSADSGAALGCAVRAHLTVTFIGLKPGLFTGDGVDCCGTVVFADLQADPEIVRTIPVVAQRLSVETITRLPARSRNAHKGCFGHVLVVGGDRGMGGAPLLCAEAALRSGAGLVSLATREEHVPAALARRPEIMCRGVASANQLLGLGEQATVCVFGPGLGQSSWGRSLLSIAPSLTARQVWDADALNLLAAGQAAVKAGSVLTPHPGEAARLLKLSTAQVQADRLSAVKRLAVEYQCVAILKGAGTLIAAPEGRVALCDRGHPAMAGAGLGDVLAGLVGALLAQGMASFDAACLAVLLHARAGERLGRSGRGLAAGDLPVAIREVLEEVCPCLS